MCVWGGGWEIPLPLTVELVGMSGLFDGVEAAFNLQVVLPLGLPAGEGG